MAELKELSISYSCGPKADLGNYENVSFHVSRSETYVLDSEDDADALYEERYLAIKKVVDDRAMRMMDACSRHTEPDVAEAAYKEALKRGEIDG